MEKTRQAERLHKILSRAGVASRRTAETLIQAGRVQVNGQTITRLGTTTDPTHDRILVDGQPLAFPLAPLYFVLHKPVGVVSTLKDPQGRTTVRDLLHDVPERVFPVGRLDYHSAGLLLLTNDGELTERLLHPRYRIPRTYHVKVTGTCTPASLTRLQNGIRLDERMVTGPAEVRVLRTNQKKTWLAVTLREGRHHEVRRMCAAVGHRVEKLIRVRFGPLVLHDLPIGAYRPLTLTEIRALKRISGLSNVRRS